MTSDWAFNHDEVLTVAYPTERDRRIYEPGYFHAHPGSKLDQNEAMEQRRKFYRMEASCASG
jgi:hypothetical protein